MPELPDIAVYLEALQSRIFGARLESTRIAHPFLLRTFEPPLDSLHGRRVVELRRVGKRVAVGFEGDHWLVLHLMIAGRLHWFAAGARKTGRAALAYFVFDTGTLTLTEAGSKRRASLYVFGSTQELTQHDPGGLEVLEAPYEEFRKRLLAENHTLKRSLTDPHTFSGIGNAYSDEILHRARLSPIALTQKLDEPSLRALYEAIRTVLPEWTERLRASAGADFPEGVTAFRPEMAVHGRFGKPCPVCAAPVQRIRYAENETNYCPGCQTGGRILADRSLSRLLKDDWPRTIDELV
ncbi:MAG TPA: DNA-formamidopyrimidine glycosylase family protein [Steroidobacteraceae bacterium]|jgi:formamidopyrimidine-DNA glycosylase|nr:DNA-formamidopyrimidine glycosylase family protein [Steroidobacteraceae bacterium]